MIPETKPFDLGRPEDRMERRQAQADEIVADWIARQSTSWFNEMTIANGGQPIMFAEIASPLIAGAMAAITRFYWATAKADATPNALAKDLEIGARAYLKKLARREPPGQMRMAIDGGSFDPPIA